MSSFPTTILLATDGSEEAQLAATTAADLAQRTIDYSRVVSPEGRGFLYLESRVRDYERLAIRGPLG
jgi:hypothetical protein